MRLSARAVLLGLVTAIAATADPRVARAGDVTVARRIFAEGVRLYQRGDWEGARRLFREADAEYHSPTIDYNLGLTEERLGHPQAAVDRYEAYLAANGDKGELASSAAVAIAQIKARSTRLRIETTPPGGRIFVDGAALDEPAPTHLLVPAGHHVIVAQGDGWRDEQTIEVRGAGDALSVVLSGSPAPPVTAAPIAAPSPLDPTSPEPVGAKEPTADAAPSEPRPDAVVWGAAFAMAPMYLLGVSNPAAANSREAASFIAGPLVEIGYALTDRFELLGRALVGIGPDGDPSYGYMGGPGLSYRVGDALWLGASFLGGRIETRVHDTRYGTELVFGTMLEAGIVILRKPYGEWLASVQPSVLLARNEVNNTTLFLPISFGYRAY